MAVHSQKILDFVVNEVPSGNINGSNKNFTISSEPIEDEVFVKLNGLIQKEGTSEDFTISGTTITFNIPPKTGMKVLVSYFR